MPEQLDKFVGTYELNGRSFNIENRNGSLFRVVQGADSKELKPESKSKLFYNDGSDRQIEFVFANNAVSEVFLDYCCATLIGFASVLVSSLSL